MTSAFSNRKTRPVVIGKKRGVNNDHRAKSMTPTMTAIDYRTQQPLPDFGVLPGLVEIIT